MSDVEEVIGTRATGRVPLGADSELWSAVRAFMTLMVWGYALTRLGKWASGPDAAPARNVMFWLLPIGWLSIPVAAGYLSRRRVTGFFLGAAAGLITVVALPMVLSGTPTGEGSPPAIPMGSTLTVLTIVLTPSGLLGVLGVLLWERRRPDPRS